MRRSSDGQCRGMQKISVSGPAELVTIVPFHLGFQPERSVVAICLRDRAVGLVARIDVVGSPHAAETAARLTETIRRLAQAWKEDLWTLTPSGTEGYAKAEVTAGGIDTDELSSTMEAKKVPGLYFIGEVVDVTGQLGGFNFQWAWASGFVAGQKA